MIMITTTIIVIIMKFIIEISMHNEKLILDNVITYIILTLSKLEHFALNGEKVGLLRMLTYR